MKFGCVFPTVEIGNDPGAIRDWIQTAEGLGYDHIIVYDHVLGAQRDRPGGFTGPYDSDTAFHEPMVLLGFIAAATRRIELVTAILILPQRQTALVAKQAAELAILSENRFRLGIGVGWNTVEFDALGESFGVRGRRMTEQVEFLRRLWTEDAFSFDGEFHRMELASILPRPSRSIPIMMGGSAPAALERCALHGDGWIPLGGPGEKAERYVASLRAHREAAGLSMDGFTIHAQAQFAGGDIGVMSIDSPSKSGVCG